MELFRRTVCYCVLLVLRVNLWWADLITSRENNMTTMIAFSTFHCILICIVLQLLRASPHQHNRKQDIKPHIEPSNTHVGGGVGGDAPGIISLGFVHSIIFAMIISHRSVSFATTYTIYQTIQVCCDGYGPSPAQGCLRKIVETEELYCMFL